MLATPGTLVIIGNYASADPRTSAYTLGAIISADKGIGTEVKQDSKGWRVITDDGKVILFYQA